MSVLAERECKPCSAETPKLEGQELEKLKSQLDRAWRVAKGPQLEREFKFKDFQEALDFTNKVGELAEEANHHPDIYLAWGKVKVTLSTHAIGGLSENDFVLAAKIDQL